MTEKKRNRKDWLGALPGRMPRTIMALDLETTRSGRIRHIGAVLGETVFERKKEAGSKSVLQQLDDFSRGAQYVLGHNLLGHDFPVLQSVSPWLHLLQKPVIDTLYLSPLAFPQNPYHRLVKDYKLVRSAINNPVEDARLAASVFADQWDRFAAMAEKNPAQIDFYRFCFQKSRFSGLSGDGLAAVFATFQKKSIADSKQACEYFIRLTDGTICRHAANRVIPGLIEDDAKRPAAAFSLAWLQVAGGNSALPPWVRHRFPDISGILSTLRDQPCREDDCAYCRENRDTEGQLRRFFGYPAFREKPQTRKGESLQQAIVNACMGNQPILGILPTGGGKSLCYQLPALVRYQRLGTLTVVVSPLQALMKDQVDNLVQKTGTLFAESISGLQTMPERGTVFERIRLGDTAILYVSPEQLRNIGVRNILKQREIGCWVFDEAHCLSKWGHDFRPDYLYAARFIREFSKEQGLPVPPVACFTATAKKSVIEEVVTHFKKELGLALQVFEGGVERQNLSFEVIPLSESEKMEQTHAIVREHLASSQDPGGVIIYAARRKTTLEIRDYLNYNGLVAEAFHAGISSAEKREIMEAFVSGRIPVICATNAFGMGIDKENIRLVLHYNIPGSLENYIQEAGRAGRDLKPARCVLLYDQDDVKLQFQMGALSEVRQKEIARILRALRRKKRNPRGEIVVTGDELIRDEDWAEMKELDSVFRDNKIRTAIAWLERAGFLKRDHNQTDVFQGNPLVKSLKEAAERMERLKISESVQTRWLLILRYILNSKETGGIRADDLAAIFFKDEDRLRKLEGQTGLTAAQIIISDLHDMAAARLVDQGLMFSAVFRPQGRYNAPKNFDSICEIENSLLDLLIETDPDADQGQWVALDIRRVNQKLVNLELPTTPEIVRRLVKGISHDGKGLAASMGSFEINHLGQSRYQVRLKRSWRKIQKTVFLRQRTAYAILHYLVDKAKKQAAETGSALTGDVRLQFTSDELAGAIDADLTLRVEIRKVLPAIERALMFLHENQVIELQNGLAVFRQAMTLRLSAQAKGRRYARGDYRPLEVHYREKRFQVHVMRRYATLALEKIAQALTLVLDYFSLGRVKFINRYFRDEKDLLDKATTAESFRMIVENLRNPIQISAVARPVDDSMLILAGPGSGKTMVIVHRCAYLLEVERIPARRILVLCFNHSSALVIRKRLFALVGKPARAVMVATYHGVALRLAGLSIRDMVQGSGTEAVDFNRIIKEACRLLRGERDIPGLSPDEHRDRLLSGYSHILVDEYQDIDADQYELVSTIVGRQETDDNSRLAIMAVGDDDQNIYTFRGANVRFIRKFQKDYSDRVIYLVENYRSSRNIISASNALIRYNKDRMKGDHPIRINTDRQYSQTGGRWETLDPVGKGQVQIVSVNGLSHQAGYVKQEIERIMLLDPKITWDDFAVLSRTRAPLHAMRSCLENCGYPFQISLEKGFPFHRIREIHRVLALLEAEEKQILRASDLHKKATALRQNRPVNAWWQLVDRFFENLREQTSDSRLPVSFAIDQLYEFAAEQRREKTIGQGIFLGTIHGVKGMEFSHAFVLDGDWRMPEQVAAQEEERRVMYVAMTRAMETLHLMKIAGQPNPFLKAVKGNCVLSRTFQGPAVEIPSFHTRYEMLGLEDLFMDYAGLFPKEQAIHHHLARLEAGHRVLLHRDEKSVVIQNPEGCCIAKLSREGAVRWSRRLERIREVRVTGMLRRTRENPSDAFSDKIQTDQWELPLLEICWEPGR